MIENTLGAAVGGALEAVLTDGDVLAVCQVVLGHNTVSKRELERKLQWSSEKVSSAFSALFSRGLLGEEYGGGNRRTVCQSAVEAFLTTQPEAAAEPQDETEPLPPQVTPEAAPRVKFAAKLEGIVAPAASPSSKPARKRRVTLAALLGEIEDMPETAVFQGADRREKIDEAFERLTDLIIQFNRGLDKLEKTCDIPFGDTPAAIVRLGSTEKFPLGGFRVTYREWDRGTGIDRVGEWPTRLTQSWIDEKVHDVESWATRTLAKKLQAAKAAKRH